MTPTQPPAPAPTGRRRCGLSPVPAPLFAESVHQAPHTAPASRAPLAPHAPQDPPLYRALLASWAERGRTLPGQYDPEWVRLAAPTVRTGQFSDFRAY